MAYQKNFRLYQELDIRIVYRPLHFSKPARTSRDVLHVRDAWYIILSDSNGCTGIGECAPIFGLSVETRHQMDEAVRRITSGLGEDDLQKLLSHYPALCMAFETAASDYQNGGLRRPFSTSDDFKISINGLVWMDNKQQMLDEARREIAEGYGCIKFKIGGIDFEDELELLRQIRIENAPEHLEIRLDANGAFGAKDALPKLERLAAFHIHSMEQPIKAGQQAALKMLVQQTPIPVALDEELIGIDTLEKKISLLDTVRPHYLVLKPTLHGGFSGADEWIALAKERNIKWWATSALESNIGLNAIARWVHTKQTEIPQGLGTGSLYSNNIASPLRAEGGWLTCTANEWDLHEIVNAP
ncbi:MAG: o-succinylbenzoate synthase [Flavobacteriales bacterium]